MIYKQGNLYINSDFEIRTINKNNDDIDIIIPTYDKTLNLYLDQTPSYLGEKFQFPLIKNILIRFNLSSSNNVATIHLLNNIDLFSAIINFEINYLYKDIIINKKDFFTEFIIKQKSIT